MELNVIENTKKKLITEVKGEDHTLMNLIRDELTKDSDVRSAGYRIAHPLIGIPQLVVETNQKTPQKAIVDAAKSLLKSDEKLKKDLSKF